MGGTVTIILGIRIRRLCLVQKNVSVAEIRTYIHTYIDTNASQMHIKSIYLARARITVLSQDFPMASNCLRRTVIVVKFIYTLLQRSSSRE